MSHSTICLKSINALLTNGTQGPANYLIPAYQRGYRWSPFQVKQLLDDIWEFIQTSENGDRKQFYCLQPLVIKVLPNGDFEVVDGQQRLTTIYILLSYLEEIANVLGKNRFQLTFATRGEANDSFLKKIDLSRSNENIDFFHICQAYRAIDEWFNGRDKMHRLKLLQHILNDDEVGRNVKVIWFELGSTDNPVEAFTRLNVGKIPLTNDELIRALFLKRKHADETEAAALQLRIANEWDLFEKGLQNNGFWYFLTNQEGRDQNRIGFLFDLVARSEGIPSGAEHDAYGVFYAFNQKLKAQHANVEKEWQKIKQIYLMLEEWFEDRSLFHIIGLLINEGMMINQIKEVFSQCTKTEAERKLRHEIFRRISMSAPPEGMPEEAVRMRLSELLESWEYPLNRAKIKSVLLLFNVATLLQNKRSNLRFQFDRFKTERWDIEHVRSNASYKPQRYSDRHDWLKHCLSFLQSQNKEEGLRAEIEEFLKLPQQGDLDSKFDFVYAKVVDYFQEQATEDADNGIANLVLLDEATNRSYKNAVFAIKRQRILSLDKAGIFVPLCTRNVFLKCYSKLVGSMVFWTELDKVDYQNTIIDTLVNFFCEKFEITP